MNSKQKVNDKCLCGSGKKYKKCCLNKQQLIMTPSNVTSVQENKKKYCVNKQQLNNITSNVTYKNENKLDNIRKAEKMYKLCLDEISIDHGYDKLVDPMTWLVNQDDMRKSWEQFLKTLETVPDMLKTIMLNNSFSKYMEFMYNTYPVGFGNEIKELNDYKPSHEQLINKIKNYLPNEELRFKTHKITGDLQIIFTNKKAIMTILEDNTWDEIKHHIDTKMSNSKSDECSICSTKETKQTQRVTCTKCASDWCVDCYINIFRENKGIIKCPFCRFTYGQQMSDYMVNMGVQQILNRV